MAGEIVEDVSTEVKTWRNVEKTKENWQLVIEWAVSMFSEKLNAYIDDGCNTIS